MTSHFIVMFPSGSSASYASAKRIYEIQNLVYPDLAFLTDIVIVSISKLLI